ncbi:MAG: hypothetical protein FK733_14965, partial [Asgard group archaeon]|nr:hypothetical protein [Asgard group archaeon]
MNSKKIKFILLVLLVNIVPLKLVQAINVGTLISFPEEKPTIDGILETDLWETRRELDIILYEIEDQSDRMTISI